MTTLLADAAAVTFAVKSWPEDVKLYQPWFSEQILMTDFANCLSVKVFLKMCGLKYTDELRKNAEFMSPSGQVPLIQVGKMTVSEFDPIVSFVRTKGYSLSANLTTEQKAEMSAYMALVTNTLQNAELWVSWCDKESAKEITKPRYGFPFAWPLNTVLPWLKERHFNRLLKHRGWADKPLSQVCEEVRTCCSALSEKLSEQEFFFGNKPCELDALVFGHLYAIFSTTLLHNDLAEVVLSFPNLQDFCKRIDNQFVKELELIR